MGPEVGLRVCAGGGGLLWGWVGVRRVVLGVLTFLPFLPLCFLGGFVAFAVSLPPDSAEVHEQFG